MKQEISPQELIDTFLQFYMTNRHKAELQGLTNNLLSICLSARGYNNYHSQQSSGEDFFIRNILAPTNPKLCIDIGANVGEFSRNLLEATSTKVIAFEPLPKVYEDLKNQLSYWSDRIIFENLGVGEKKETLSINYNDKSTAHASFSEEVKGVSYLDNKDTLELPITSLDLYLDDKEINEINLIKIDTEGFESEVLNGANKTICKFKPQFIQIEFNWHQLFRNKTLNWFAERLTDYDCYQLLPDNWIKRDPKDPLSNIFLYSNFIFVRNN